MAGALEQLTGLLDQQAASQKSAFDAANSAQDEYISALSRPRNSKLPALQLAAGLLSPTRSGSFFEGLGKGVAGYADAVGKEEDAEMDRTAKIAQIKLAKANLLGQFGNQQAQLGMSRFKLPGLALESTEATQDYEDLISGKSDIPPMPGAGPQSSNVPTPGQPAPAAPGGSPLPAPNANVASLDPVALEAQIRAGGGDEMLMGGEGDDDLSFASQGYETAPPPHLNQQQPPQQMAQAAPQGGAPGASPAPAMPQPSLQQQQYNWALQVRSLAAQNPRRWGRRQENKTALDLANKIIDDYRASQTAAASQALSQERFNILKERQDLTAQKAEKDPFVAAVKKGEADTILKSREAAEQATRSIQNFDIIEELRKRPVATGPLGQWVTRGADLVGMGGGQALEGRGVELWVQAVEPLKGALSNQEGARFDAANPGNLSMNDPEAKILIGLGRAAAQRLQQKNAFIEAYHENNGTLQGAEQAWSRFLEERPIIHVDKEGNETLLKQNVDAWQEYAAPNPALRPTGERRAPVDSARGSDVPQIRSVEEYNALPKGAPYIDPNGKPRVKQ